MKHLLTTLLSLTLLYSCSSESDSNKEKDSKAGSVGKPAIATDRQLNINILWDLSDRIDTAANPASPQHYERDVEIIKTIASVFKKDMEKRGAYKAKGRIRVFFSPPPTDSRINAIATSLSCDLSAYSGDGANRRKKELHDSIESRFSKNAMDIYRLTMAGNKGQKSWDGSDIWRFFKNDVADYCVDASGGYRNILVVLTDGYIYHKDSKEKKGNRTTYILPDVLKSLRNNSNWRRTFADGDYGLISARHDLQNLDVLVLEITPSKEYKDDEDLIKAYLGKWFEEMGVQKSNYACYNTDLPEYTRKKIENFLLR